MRELVQKVELLKNKNKQSEKEKDDLDIQVIQHR